MRDTSTEAVEKVCTDLLVLDTMYRMPIATRVAHTLAALATERDALRAALEKTRAVLEQIESHRRLCMRYDEENGHVPRTFDEEDLRIMEIAARAALNEIAEWKDNE